VTIRSKKPYKPIQTLLEDIASPDLFDFKIVVEGEVFETHKFILSGNIWYRLVDRISS
jgi:hypothetical protein